MNYSKLIEINCDQIDKALLEIENENHLVISAKEYNFLLEKYREMVLNYDGIKMAIFKHIKEWDKKEASQ